MGGYFAGIGGQKCGTSWLARYLYDHPQVLDHPIKEMHVFDWMFEPELTLDTPARARRQVDKLRGLVAALDEPHNQPHNERQRLKIELARERRERRLQAREELLAIVESADRDEALKRYREYFTSRVGPEHRAFGEVTPAYALLPDEGWTTILSVYPDAKFVFLMRDPVDRMSSSLRHILRDHPEVDMDESFDSYLVDDAFVARTTYEATLASLGRTVPPEQVLNLFYEDLFAADDDSTLRQVTDFLDIEFVEGDRGTTVNEGGSWTMSDEQKATTARAFAGTYAAVEQAMGRLPGRWQEHLARA
jgi:hypothetical protein